MTPPPSPFPRVFLSMNLANGGGKVLPRQDGVIPAYPDWGEISINRETRNALIETQLDGVWVRWLYQPDLPYHLGRFVVEFLQSDRRIYTDVLPPLREHRDNEGDLWAIAEPWLLHLPEMLVARAL